MEISNKPSTNPKFAKISFCTLYAKSVYDNFKMDIESFMDLLEKEKSLNYADFATIWQSKNFTLIFAGQSYVKCLKIFCELALSIIKKYLIYQPNIYTQIGAFYLLYAFFYKQPIRKDVTIRLTLEEHKTLKTLLNKMLEMGQYDALYIYAKMKTDEAFDFVGHTRPLSMTSKSNNDSELSNVSASREFSTILNDFENVLNGEMVQALNNTCTSYDAKMLEYTKRHPGLVPFQTTIINDLKETHSSIMRQTRSMLMDSEAKSSEVLSKRQTVRNKAVAARNSLYRGSRKVITAADLDQ